MGCDIHAYVEYYDVNTGQTRHATCYGKDVIPFRCYRLFNLMAGVRGGPGDKALHSPRGIPDSPALSYDVEREYYMAVLDEGRESPILGTFISRKDADALISSGRGKYAQDGKSIVNPSWHTPSFLFKKELMEIRRHYLLEMLYYDCQEYTPKKRKELRQEIQSLNEIELMKKVYSPLESPCLNAVIASMIAVENSGNFRARLVFWFDS
jgi:hypothetical protein